MATQRKKTAPKKAKVKAPDDFAESVAKHREEWRAIQALPGPDWEALHESIERLKELTRRLERKYGRARV